MFVFVPVRILISQELERILLRESPFVRNGKKPQDFFLSSLLISAAVTAVRLAPEIYPGIDHTIAADH
jgi:hypothetical protein